MPNNLDELLVKAAELDAVGWVFLIAGLAGILIVAWYLHESWVRKYLPQHIKKHVELLLKALRKDDKELLMDPSLHFLAKHLVVDLYAPKYGDPENFFWDGLIKFLKDVLKKHKESAPEARLFSVEEIDRIISELDERILTPGTVVCFECGEKILPDQDRCPGCGWDWQSSFECPECEAEMQPGQDRCALCGWIWK